MCCSPTPRPGSSRRGGCCRYRPARLPRWHRRGSRRGSNGESSRPPRLGSRWSRRLAPGRRSRGGCPAVCTSSRCPSRDRGGRPVSRRSSCRRLCPSSGTLSARACSCSGFHPRARRRWRCSTSRHARDRPPSTGTPSRRWPRGHAERRGARVEAGGIAAGIDVHVPHGLVVVVRRRACASASVGRHGARRTGSRGTSAMCFRRSRSRRADWPRRRAMRCRGAQDAHRPRAYPATAATSAGTTSRRHRARIRPPMAAVTTSRRRTSEKLPTTTPHG